MTERGIRSTARARLLRGIKLTVFALVPSVLLLGVAEGVAMLTISRRTVVLSDSLDLERTYSLRVGHWPWSRRTATPLNSLGFPDEEFPAASDPKRCRRVVLAGDSFVFGDGVDRDSSFVEILRRRVASRTTGPCVEVFNLGVRGTTIAQQARRVRASLPFLKPDLVIVGQYQNDLSDLLNLRPGDTLLRAAPPLGTMRPGVDRGPRAPAPTEVWGRVQERVSLFRPHLVRLLSYVGITWMIEHDIRRDELRHWSVLEDTTQRERSAELMRRYASTFDSLASDLGARGVALGVLVLPSKLDLLAGRFPEEPFFLQLADRHRIPALRVFPLLDSLRSPSPYLRFDGHLNERGNRIVAEALDRWILGPEASRFPVLLLPIADMSAASR